MKRIVAFDSMRVLAILGVIFYHLMPNHLAGGFLGVNIFFALSGYLLTVQLEKAELNFASLKIIFINRIKRIWLSMFTMSVVTVVLVTVLQPGLLSRLRSIFLASLVFLNNWWQVASGLSYFDRHFGQSPLTHLWYLSVLIQLYLVWILAFFVLKQYSKRQKVAAIFVASLIALSSFLMLYLYVQDLDPSRVYYGTDTRAFSFFFGVLAYYVYPYFQKQWLPLLKPYRVVINSLLALFLFSFFILARDSYAFTYRFGFLLFDMAFFFFMLSSLLPNATFARVYESKALIALSKRSYTWYLWYFPIIAIYQYTFKGDSLIHVLIPFLLLVVVGEVAYRWIDNNPKFKVGHIVGWSKDRLQRLQRGQILSSLNVPIFLCFFASIIFLFGMIISSDAPNPEVAALQEIIESNQKLVENNKNGESSQTSSPLAPGETDSEPITFVGDSILLMIADKLKETYPNAVIDGKVSRQLYHAKPVIESLKAEGKLANRVVLILGANAPANENQIKELLDAIGSDRKIYLVNLYANESWEEEQNQRFSKLTQEYANLSLINWHQLVSLHAEEWLSRDKVHPKPGAVQPFIELIYQSVSK